MMGIEEEDSGRNQGDVEVFDIDLHLLGVDIHQRDRRKLGDLPRRLGELKTTCDEYKCLGRGDKKTRRRKEETGEEEGSVRCRRGGGKRDRRHGRIGGGGPCRGCRG